MKYQFSLLFFIFLAFSLSGCGQVMDALGFEEGPKVLKRWEFKKAKDTKKEDIEVVGFKTTDRMIDAPAWSVGTWGRSKSRSGNFKNKYIALHVGDVNKHEKLSISITCAVVDNGPHKLQWGFFKDDELIGRSKVMSPTTTFKTHGPYPIPKEAYQNLQLRLEGFGANTDKSGTLHIKEIVLYRE